MSKKYFSKPGMPRYVWLERSPAIYSLWNGVLVSSHDHVIIDRQEEERENDE